MAHITLAASLTVHDGELARKVGEKLREAAYLAGCTRPVLSIRLTAHDEPLEIMVECKDQPAPLPTWEP